MSYNMARVESDEKDIIISQLRADLYELKQNEKEYNELLSYYENINNKVSSLMEEKSKNEREANFKRDSIYKNMIDLKKQLEQFRADQKSINEKYEEAYQNNKELRKKLEVKNNDLTSVKKDLGALSEKIKAVNNSKNELLQKNKEFKQEKKRVGEDLKNLKAKFETIAINNKEIIKNLTELEQERNRLEINHQDTLKVYDSKNQEFKEKNLEKNKNEQNLCNIEKDSTFLDQDYVNLQNNFNEEKMVLESLKEKFVAENERGKENEGIKAKLSDKLIIQKEYMTELKKEGQTLRDVQEEIRKDNSYLLNEIRRHQSILDHQKSIKNELTESLVYYGENNEKARNFLIFKENMKQNMEKSDARIDFSQKSINEILKRYS